MSIKASIVRDTEGFPVLAVVTQGAQKIEVVYEKDSGFTLSGSRRSLENQALVNALRLIYPTQDKIDLVIPQPLQVSQVYGGDVIFYDDMEGLLKWQEVGATVALDNTQAFNGSQSLKITAAAGGVAQARRYFPKALGIKASFECVFAVDNFAKLDQLYFRLQRQEGTASHYGSFGYVDAAHWGIVTAGGGTRYLPNLDPLSQYETKDSVGGAWFTLKGSVDFLKQQYIKLEVEGREAILGAEALAGGAGAFDACNYVNIYVDAAAGQDVNVWIDDFIVKEIP